jgi:hypothetical protein
MRLNPRILKNFRKISNLFEEIGWVELENVPPVSLPVDNQDKTS